MINLSAFVGFSVARRRWLNDPNAKRVASGMSLMFVGLTVAALPRAIGLQNEGILIGASIVSLVATIAAAVTMFGSRKSWSGSPDA